MPTTKSSVRHFVPRRRPGRLALIGILKKWNRLWAPGFARLQSEAIEGATSLGGREKWLLSLSSLSGMIESAILAMGLVATILGKSQALSRLSVPPSPGALATILAADVVFLGILILLMALLVRTCPASVSRGINLILAISYGIWSGANMAWLRATGSQLHVGVVESFLRNFIEFGSIVAQHLRVNRGLTFLLAITACLVVAGGCIAWLRPGKPPTTLQGRRVGMKWAAMLLIVSGFIGWRAASSPDPRVISLSFSAHAFALSSLCGFDGSNIADNSALGRFVPRQGERRLVATASESQRPHVILIIMESTGHWATSLGGRRREDTPTLARLADEGIVIDQTRAVVTHTTQSLFTMLTGVSPNSDGRAVEMVSVDKPYESLATLLGARGYRSRFSQMVRATFENRPGLIANLGFDSFWSREDAKAPESHLGYFAGDDFKMIEPAFNWLDRQPGPCLMVFMTSVSHHPYELPSWYGPTPRDTREAYLECVRYTDSFVSGILDQLSRRNVIDDSLVCIVGDHGEGMPNHRIALHNESPYDEVLRVPWIISWPNHVTDARVVHGPHSLMDVTPTLLSLLGYGIENAGFEGVDSLAHSHADRQVWFSGWYRASPIGFCSGNSKFVYFPGLAQGCRYDLDLDPGETQAVILDNTELARLARSAQQWIKDRRIAFDPKRYRQTRAFEHWQITSLGDSAWCFHGPDSAESPP